MKIEKSNANDLASRCQNEVELLLKELKIRRQYDLKDADTYKGIERVAKITKQHQLKLTEHMINVISSLYFEVEAKNHSSWCMNKINETYFKLNRYSRNSEDERNMRNKIDWITKLRDNTALSKKIRYELEIMANEVNHKITRLQNEWKISSRERFMDVKQQYSVLIGRVKKAEPKLRKNPRFRDAVRKSFAELNMYVRGESELRKTNSAAQMILLINKYSTRKALMKRSANAKAHYKRFVGYRKSSKNPEVHELAKSAIKDLNAYLKEGIRPVLKPKYEGIEALIKEEKARANFQHKMKMLEDMLCPKLPLEDIDEVKGLLKDIGDYAPLNSLKPLAEGLNLLKANEVRKYLSIAAKVNCENIGILTEIPAYLKSYEAQDKAAYLNFLALMSNRGAEPAECHRKLGVAMTMVRDRKHFFKSLEIFYHNPRKNDIDGSITVAKMYGEIPYNRPGLDKKIWYGTIRDRVGSMSDC